MSRPLVVLFAIFLLASVSLVAEVPETFENLEVFPKDIPKRELVDSMRSISNALGVRCSFCHEMKVPGEFESFVWASDKLEHKAVARDMMRMTQKINGDLLPESHGEGRRVTCYTCHRGMPEPTTLKTELLEAVEDGGIDEGIRRYHDLREQYYGTGSLDFGPDALLDVAETTAQDQKDLEAAGQWMDLAIEMDPDFAMNYMMRAQIHAQSGATDKAKADLQKALELDPENEHAKRMLGQL